jgi:three-Cys-motif partner protein
MRKHTELGVEERFFDYPRESSRIKQKCVVDYFLSWTNVLARNRTVGYADLFTGPGRYKNGEKSIPILIAERVIQDERLRTWVKLWFNEGDPEYACKLEANVLALPGIDSLHYRPAFTQKVVGKTSPNTGFRSPHCSLQTRAATRAYRSG